jgi:hypothetical protein
MTDTPLIVHRCTDFTVTGKGENPEWQKAQWVALNKIDKGGKEYESKFKILYSSTGIYELINWAIKSNMQSVITDCPHREKLSWLEQDYLMGASVHSNFDILTNWILKLRGKFEKGKYIFQT